MRRLILAILAVVMLPGCGFTLLQREKHAYTLIVVSKPKWQPGKSWLEHVVGGDVKTVTGMLAVGGVATEAVRAAGSTELILAKQVYPSDRNYKHKVRVTYDSVEIESEPLPIQEKE